MAYDDRGRGMLLEGPPGHQIVPSRAGKRSSSRRSRDREYYPSSPVSSAPSSSPLSSRATVGVAFLVGILLMWVFVHFGLNFGTEDVIDRHNDDKAIARGIWSDQTDLSRCKMELAESRKEVESLLVQAGKQSVKLDPFNTLSNHAASVLKGNMAAPPTNTAPLDPLMYDLSALKKKTVDDTIILTFCSIKYLPSLVNWLALMHKHRVTNFGIVCLDTALRGWLQDRGSECQYILGGWKHGVWNDPEPQKCTMPGSVPAKNDAPTLAKCKNSCEYDTSCRAINWNTRTRECQKCEVGYVTVPTPEQTLSMYVKRTEETLWFARWKLLVRLLHSNIHVMMSDLDAMFLTDPRPFLNKVALRADLIAQRGSFPDWLSREWGAALCMGFVYWRSTETTKRFLVHMDRVIANTGDDQIAVNVALAQMGIKWEAGKMLFANSTSVDYGTIPMGMTVALLPHQGYPRRCDEIELAEFQKNVQVAHCFESKKDGDAKKKRAQMYGLWALKDGWETMPPVGGTLDAYLESVTAS